MNIYAYKEIVQTTVHINNVKPITNARSTYVWCWRCSMLTRDR